METSAGPGNTFSMQCCSCDSSSSCCWCVDCNEALCGSCLLAHRRVKITRSHQILNEPPAGAVKTPPTKYCKLHPSEPLKLFCFTCHQLTCRDCQLINHMNHRYQFVSEALDKLKKQMDCLLQPFRAQSDTVRRSLQDMETRLQDIAESEVQLQTELHHAHRVLIQHMKNRTMEILKKVKEMSEQESEQIRVRMMNLKQLQEQRQTLTERAEAAKNTSDLTQLLYFATQVQALTRKVSDQDLSPPQNMAHLKVITDKPALDAILNFGKLQVASIPFSVNQPSPQNTYDPAVFQDQSLSSQSFASSSCSLTTSLPCSSPASSSTSTVPIPSQTVGDVRTNRQQLMPKSQTLPVSASLVLQPANPASNVLKVVLNQQTCSLTTSLPCSSSATSSTSTVPVPAQTVGDVRTNRQQLMHKSQTQPVSTSLVLQPANPASNVLKVVLNQQTVPPQNQPAFVQLADALAVYQMSGLTVPFGMAHLPLLLNQNVSYAQPGLAWSSTRETSNQTTVNKQNCGRNQVLIVGTKGTTAGPSHHAPQQQTPHHQPLPVHKQIAYIKTFLDNKQTPHHQPLPEHQALPVHNQMPDHQELPNHLPLQVHKQTADKEILLDTKQTVDQESLPVRKLMPDKQILESYTSLKQLLIRDHEQTSDSQPIQENHSSWDHKQTPCNQSWQEQKQSPDHEPLLENQPQVLTPTPLSKQLLPHQLSPLHKQSQEDPPLMEIQPLPVQKQSTDQQPLLAHQTSLVLSQTTDIQPLPDNKETPQHQPLQDETSSYVPSCSEISPCSSVKSHQPGLVVKAMADSACDSSVQQVTLRHQEPAENEPTSTVSEEPEPAEKPSTPEVLDSDTEEQSSEIGSQDFKLSLWQPRVSLDRLPLVLSHPGSPLPSFRLVPGDAEDEFYLEELSEDSESHDDDITDDHSKPQWHDDDITDDLLKPQGHDDEVSDCYREPLLSPDSPLTLQTVGCSACQSPNGSIICSACGRGYHRDCHVPPVGCDIWMEWTCSLCQDLTDPSDPYSSDRPPRAKTPSLSLLDQRRCESLLLYVKVKGCTLPSQMDWVWSRLKTISERLTQQRTPWYETSAELLYDVWKLFKGASQDVSVNQLQEDFNRKVAETFCSDLPCPEQSPPRRSTHTEREKPAETHTGHAVMSQVEQLSEGSEVKEVFNDECELNNTRKRLGDFLDLNEAKKRKMDNTTLSPSRSPSHDL